MDGAAASSSAREDAASTGVLRQAQVAATALDPMNEIARQLGQGPFDVVCLFASPDADFAAISAASKGLFGEADVLACSTAGELGASGYEDGQIIAIALPARHFAVTSYAIDTLDALNGQEVIDTLIQRRLDLARRAPDKTHEFAFLMVDGLSLREEHLTSLLASGLGPMPLFGGSSGDGTRFEATYLSRNGVVRQNAALLALVRTDCPVQVFSLDHLIPTETRMVVTSADPDARIVHEINAEPAAAEYARLLGKDPHQLDPFTFAAHPVVVRLGDTHHVRAIQRVNEDGHLVFFSAINEGMVLTLAAHTDIADHLRTGLQRLGNPDTIIACDCLLRRIAAGQNQQTHEISQLLRDHNVAGFSTYGEQIGGLHVNQTLTGVAIYPPSRGA